jgi:predicted dehydrogenase
MSDKQDHNPTVRVAIIGTGSMAHTHAASFRGIKGCRVVAACDIDQSRAEAFAAKYGIPKVFTRIDALVEGADFDAASIVAPDAQHAPAALKCLRAGKHVLCEKPLATSYREALRMVAAAKRAGTVNMVNLSYRNWSALGGVADAVRRGEIGEVRHVEASYLQGWLLGSTWGDWRTTPALLWRLSTRHGSRGVLGDLGVHLVDFATYPAGPITRVHCRLKAFAKARGNRIGEYVFDANDSAVMVAEFANGAIGTLHTTRWCGGHENSLFLRISGDRGTLEMDSDRSTTRYRICAGRGLKGAKWREIRGKSVPSIYQRFITAISKGGGYTPDFARGAAVQKVLEACFASNSRGVPVDV